MIVIFPSNVLFEVVKISADTLTNKHVIGEKINDYFELYIIISEVNSWNKMQQKNCVMKIQIDLQLTHAHWPEYLSLS